MSIKSKLRGLTSIVVGAATLALSSPRIDADVSGNIKYIQTTQESNSLGSYPEANVFYGLPRGISGYTFLDLYNHDGGYFGRTSWTKDFRDTDELALKLEGNHINTPLSDIGFGARVNIPKLPESIYGNVSLMPFYFNKKGVVTKSLFQYYATTNLPYNLNLSSFGEWNLRNGQWEYGEVELAKDLGFFRAGYNCVLLNNSDAIPTLEHRASVIVDF